MAVTGQDGLPPLEKAGNVLLPQVTLNLSLRLPPTVDPRAAQQALREAVEPDPPFGAKVTLHFHEPAAGWNAPPLAPWLGEGAPPRLHGGVEPTGDVHGRGRLDPVHGDAG